jgi:dUTP pyrophosphatase
MMLKMKKLDPKAVIPRFATEGSAGLDLTAISRETVIEESGNYYVRFRTGLAIEIPDGYVGLIFPRSSIFKTPLVLTNCVGVIDSDYRGEISFIFKMVPHAKNIKDAYKEGDRIGQLVIVPIPSVEILEVDELTETSRGSGGFGSTGN